MIENLIRENKKIILFDGECNLCHWFVQLLLKNEVGDIFRFISLQSSLGKNIQGKYGINTKKNNSVILIGSHVDYKLKTTAIFSIIRSMRMPWPLFQIFLLVPRFLRDWVYDFFVKNRYFGLVVKIHVWYQPKALIISFYKKFFMLHFTY